MGFDPAIVPLVNWRRKYVIAKMADGTSVTHFYAGAARITVNSGSTSGAANTRGGSRVTIQHHSCPKTPAGSSTLPQGAPSRRRSVPVAAAH